MTDFGGVTPPDPIPFPLHPLPAQPEGLMATRSTTEPRSSLKKHGAVTNGLLGAICAAELPLFPINRLAGLSAFVLARKP